MPEELKSKIRHILVKNRKIVHGPLKTKCWAWTGMKHGNGYGGIMIDGKPVMTHRASWITYRGEIPKGLQVCHKCDVRLCFNPRHLFLATQSENILDAYKKGRIKRQTGESHGQCKLTEDSVKKIRVMYSSGRFSQSNLANRFSVTRANISLIVLNRAWKHV